MILEARQPWLTEGQAAGMVHTHANSKVSVNKNIGNTATNKGPGDGRPHSNQSSKEPAIQKWHLF